MKKPVMHGFSLIELMIVLAIVGILSAVAIPSYRDSVLEAKMVAAQSGIMQIKSRFEQFYGDNRTYVGFPIGRCQPLEATPEFTYDCATGVTATSYTISASGSGSMAGISYSITNTNTKTSSTASPAPWTFSGSCWVSKWKGSCS